MTYPPSRNSRACPGRGAPRCAAPLRSLWLAAALALAAAAQARATCPAGDYPAHYSDAAPFEAAIEATSGQAPWPDRVTGLTLPHHLVVPEMIAGGYRLAADEKPQRILLLMPDHFRAASAPFATSARGYQTVLGPVPGDPAASDLLTPGLIEDSCLFGADHAIRSHLPLIARLFPGVPVLPLAVGLSTTQADWQAALEKLRPLLGPEVLVVQSTDFSHYLPHHEARQRDQEVLNLLAAGDSAGLARLHQPGHVDSAGANWMQLGLQRDIFGAAPLLLANRNQQELSAQPLAETTSYMVILYSPDRRPRRPEAFPGAKMLMLGGDLFLGRIWPRLLSDELVSARVEAAALAATGGLPLVVNLEGSVLPETPGNLPHLTLAMPADLLASWADRLNLRAVSLANNHHHDLGAAGIAETGQALRAAGLPFLRQGESLELDGITLVALSDLRGGAAPDPRQLGPDLLDRLIHPDPSKPVLAFVHWGEEWETIPGPRQLALSREMAARGVTAIIGAHPHAASAAPVALGGGSSLMLYSLGNFLFDQTSPPASGALAELSLFDQGTLFVRALPLPPLFDLARSPTTPP